MPIATKKHHDHFVAREGYEKELESIDVGDGPGLRQAGDEQSTTTQRRDGSYCCGRPRYQGLLKFNFESAPPSKADLEASSLFPSSLGFFFMISFQK